MDNLLMTIAGLAVPVTALMEVLKQGILKRLQVRNGWSDQTYAAIVTALSVLASYAVLGAVMLSGAAFPLLPAIGLNADFPLISWLFGGLAVWLANWGQHQVFLNLLSDLVRLFSNLADVPSAKAASLRK